jgi:hypothetical protein
VPDRPVSVDVHEASRQLAWDRLWDLLLSRPPALDESETGDSPTHEED